MPDDGLAGVENDISADAGAFDFDLTPFDPYGPLLFSGVQACRGEIRQHALTRAFRTDLFSVRPPSIECHGDKS